MIELFYGRAAILNNKNCIRDTLGECFGKEEEKFSSRRRFMFIDDAESTKIKSLVFLIEIIRFAIIKS